MKSAVYTSLYYDDPGLSGPRSHQSGKKHEQMIQRQRELQMQASYLERRLKPHNTFCNQVIIAFFAVFTFANLIIWFAGPRRFFPVKIWDLTAEQLCVFCITFGLASVVFFVYRGSLRGSRLLQSVLRRTWLQQALQRQLEQDQRALEEEQELKNSPGSATRAQQLHRELYSSKASSTASPSSHSVSTGNNARAAHLSSGLNRGSLLSGAFSASPDVRAYQPKSDLGSPRSLLASNSEVGDGPFKPFASPNSDASKSPIQLQQMYQSQLQQQLTTSVSPRGQLPQQVYMSQLTGSSSTAETLKSLVSSPALNSHTSSLIATSEADMSVSPQHDRSSLTGSVSSPFRSPQKNAESVSYMTSPIAGSPPSGFRAALRSLVYPWSNARATVSLALRELGPQSRESDSAGTFVSSSVLVPAGLAVSQAQDYGSALFEFAGTSSTVMKLLGSIPALRAFLPSRPISTKRGFSEMDTAYGLVGPEQRQVTLNQYQDDTDQQLDQNAASSLTYSTCYRYTETSKVTPQAPPLYDPNRDGDVALVASHLLKGLNLTSIFPILVDGIRQWVAGRIVHPLYKEHLAVEHSLISLSQKFNTQQQGVNPNFVPLSPVEFRKYLETNYPLHPVVLDWRRIQSYLDLITTFPVGTRPGTGTGTAATVSAAATAAAAAATAAVNEAAAANKATKTDAAPGAGTGLRLSLGGGLLSRGGTAGSSSLLGRTGGTSAFGSSSVNAATSAAANAAATAAAAAVHANPPTNPDISYDARPLEKGHRLGVRWPHGTSSYVLSRLEALAQGEYMEEFAWNGSGQDIGRPWSPRVPTDSHIIMDWFIRYLSDKSLDAVDRFHYADFSRSGQRLASRSNASSQSGTSSGDVSTRGGSSSGSSVNSSSVSSVNSGSTGVSSSAESSRTVQNNFAIPEGNGMGESSSSHTFSTAASPLVGVPSLATITSASRNILAHTRGSSSDSGVRDRGREYDPSISASNIVIAQWRSRELPPLFTLLVPSSSRGNVRDWLVKPGSNNVFATIALFFFYIIVKKEGRIGRLHLSDPSIGNIEALFKGVLHGL